MRRLTEILAGWLQGGGSEIGEIRIRSAGEEFLLIHREDAGREDRLATSRGPAQARTLAQFDDHGGYRPLKTAPNLRHGWKLIVSGVGDLRRALDYFYPGALGIWFSHRCGTLAPVPFRSTLLRQSGMYAVTKKITDSQATATIAGCCRTDGGCLKRILWPLAPGVPVMSLPSHKMDPSAPAEVMPLLCPEACNLLIARTREVLKRAESIA